MAAVAPAVVDELELELLPSLPVAVPAQLAKLRGQLLGQRHGCVRSQKCGEDRDDAPLPCVYQNLSGCLASKFPGSISGIRRAPGPTTNKLQRTKLGPVTRLGAQRGTDLLRGATTATMSCRPRLPRKEVPSPELCSAYGCPTSSSGTRRIAQNR